MNWVKGFALATCLAMPLSTIVATSSMADPVPAASDAAKPTSDGDKAKSAGEKAKRPNKAALKAMRDQCSREADKKGLKGKSKSDARKAFRSECLSKMGVESN